MKRKSANASEPEFWELVWLADQVTTPPFSSAAAEESLDDLGRICQGDKLSMPVSRPMPDIGKRCHELRVTDKNVTSRHGV